MKKKFRNFQEILLEELRDQHFAHLYLNDALTDEDPRMLLLALANVYEAQGGKMADLAQKTTLSEKSVHHILSSKKGDPELSSIISLANAIGFPLTVTQLKNNGHSKK